MLVRAKKACFVGGSRRKEGEEFDYTGPKSPDLVPVKSAEKAKAKPEAPVDGNPMTDDQLVVRLAEYGVKATVAMGREELLSLLAKAEGKPEPGKGDSNDKQE